MDRVKAGVARSGTDVLREVLIDLLRDLSLYEALAKLSAAGFKTFVMEAGTILAYKSGASLRFGPRKGRFSHEAITRAIEDYP